MRSTATVANDFDGDGKSDMAVWRGAEGNWYIRRSSDDQVKAIHWGSSSAPYPDVAVPGDYDGDGKTDVAIWRSTNNVWFVQCSRDQALMIKPNGQQGDTPVGARP